MQQAYAQANEIVLVATNQAQEILDNATKDADEIRMAAIQYTDDILRNLENIVIHAIDTTRSRSDSLIASLQECLEVVGSNRGELAQAADEEVPEEEIELPEIQLEPYLI